MKSAELFSHSDRSALLFRSVISLTGLNETSSRGKKMIWTVF